MMCMIFCFKQKTAYEMRISDWSSDVCSSDLTNTLTGGMGAQYLGIGAHTQYREDNVTVYLRAVSTNTGEILKSRSEEHTSELQSLMRISYAIFCLKKKKKI